MRTFTTILRSVVPMTNSEASVILWLSGILIVGTLGSNVWPQHELHAHVAPQQIMALIDSADDHMRDTVVASSPLAQRSHVSEGLTTKINVNRASSTQLELIPGIGPAMAKRIIEARTKRKFTAVEDLLEVKGIGKKKLEHMRPFITAP